MSETQANIQIEVLSKVLRLVETDDGIPGTELSDEEVLKRLQYIHLSLQNHNDTVQQNKSLQRENALMKNEINKFRNKPFFPYPLNNGNRTDFGDFYLISYAWFNSLNTTDIVGIIEVEYKTNDRPRKMYIGIGKGKDITADVLSIATYGQKIKG